MQNNLEICLYCAEVKVESGLLFCDKHPDMDLTKVVRCHDFLREPGSDDDLTNEQTRQLVQQARG